MSERSAALARLDAFVGEWSIEAVFPNLPTTDTRGRVVFEWMTGGLHGDVHRRRSHDPRARASVRLRPATLDDVPDLAIRWQAEEEPEYRNPAWTSTSIRPCTGALMDLLAEELTDPA